jgi:hypothetical protein
MAKTTITQDDYIKAVKKADREREIALHGKVISTRPTKTHQSKKAYNRKNNKNIDIND